jgi:hypothetical protein
MTSVDRVRSNLHFTHLVASLPFRPCFQPVHQALVPLGRHTGPLLSEYKYKAKQAKRRQQQPTKLTNSVLLLVFVSQCPHKTSHRTIYLSAIVWCGPLLTLSSNREISQQESFSQASTKRAQDCLCPKKRFHSTLQRPREPADLGLEAPALRVCSIHSIDKIPTTTWQLRDYNDFS